MICYKDFVYITKIVSDVLVPTKGVRQVGEGREGWKGLREGER